MKKYRIPKLIGLTILTMLALILISFAEVAVYSMLINTGQPIEVYDTHAMATAPWISTIFGFIFFFLVVRYWKKKKHENVLTTTLLFWSCYITLDIAILISFETIFSEIYLIFILANGAKLLGGLAAYKFVKVKI